MIDIHNHVLQGIDDGSRSLEESIELVKKAKELGYEALVLTSHYHSSRGYFSENYGDRLEELRRALEERNISMELYEGNEVFLGMDYRKILEERKFRTINGSRYLLVEIDPMEIPLVTEKKLKYVMELGYLPILAHCERYINFKVRDLYKLKSMGVFLQVNIGSWKGKKKLLKKIIKFNLIDFLGSDVHGVKRRNYELKEELKKFKKYMGRKYFKEVTQENGRRVLKDLTLEKEKRDEKKGFNLRDRFNSIWNNIFSGNGIGRYTEESRN
ncbi:MAG: tyrosine-protein phosphatase [Cetobacterium sp.]